MKNKIIINNLILFIFSIFTCTNIVNASSVEVEYDLENKEIFFGETTVKFGLDMECGMFSDRALYASFGLETQIYKCSKIVLPVSLKYRKWFGKLELAPLYDSVKREYQDVVIYSQDSQSRDIDGNNRYFDWYKNLGSRTYLVDEYPVREAYVGYSFTESLKFNSWKSETLCRP